MASDELLQKSIDEYIDTIYDRAAADFNAAIDSAIEQLKSKRLTQSKSPIILPTAEVNTETLEEIPVTLQKDTPPEELGEMICDNCGDSFTPVKKTVRVVHAYCGDECKDEFKAKESHYKHLKKKQHKLQTVLTAPNPEPDKVETPMPSSTTLINKPKVIKSNPVTIKDYTKLVHKDRSIDDAPMVTADNETPSDPNFSDPWDCQVCRQVSHLCNFHKQLQDKGVVPRTKIDFMPQGHTNAEY